MTATRTRLVLGNWKMHGNLADNAKLLGALLAAPRAGSATQMGVCVPFPYLAQTAQALTGSSIAWGAQDISTQAQGAYTGEVSGAMLKDFACRFVLVGHSERRAMHAESDQLVADKASASLKAGMTPVVCVGESLAARDAGQAVDVIARQLAPVLALGAEAVKKMVLAYEPVWAIGTGLTASPEQAQEIHSFIRTLLAAQYGQELADNMTILYGGSCNPKNASELFAQPDIDGGLIGGASLKARDFVDIIKALDR